MYALALSDEFWTCNSVLNRRGICHPEGYIANDHWRTCREVREALVEAVVARQ
jgi:hypothetical protein